MPTHSVGITISELIVLKRAKFPHRQSTDTVHRPCQLYTLSGAGYLCLRDENPSPEQFAAIEIMNGILLRSLLSHKVDHGLDSVSIGHLFDFGHMRAISDHRLIGTPALGQFEGGGRAIHDDDFGRRQGFEALDADGVGQGHAGAIEVTFGINLSLKAAGSETNFGVRVSWTGKTEGVPAQLILNPKIRRLQYRSAASCHLVEASPVDRYIPVYLYRICL